MQRFSEKNPTSLGLAGGMAALAAASQPNEGGSAAVNLPKALDDSGGGEQATPAHSGSEDGRGGAAANRLEKRTHLNEASYRITLRNYGNGLGEIGWSFRPTLKPTKAARGSSESREENESRAVRRAKSRIRQRILAAQTDHLLTLTYRENMTDYDRAWRKSLERAGIADFRWHDLRHTWATWQRQAGTPTHELQRLGGWRTGAMVERYAHLALAASRLAYVKVSAHYLAHVGPIKTEQHLHALPN